MVHSLHYWSKHPCEVTSLIPKIIAIPDVLAFQVWLSELALQVLVDGFKMWSCQHLFLSRLRELWPQIN